MQDKWWQHAVVYQIYPRSFQDSNGDGIGDLKGIIKRLPYIKKLGANVIWLNPIYQSPDKDNGYDISNYRQIAPIYGTMADFKMLLTRAHQLGIRLIMDLVVNHTSDQHPWFQKSRQGKTNSFADFYIWRDPVHGHAPNNWASWFNGPAWTYDKCRGQYYLHLFSAAQPDLNWENPAVRSAVYHIMTFWLDLGIDGFRLDVINLLSKPAGLPDAPRQAGARYGNSGLIVPDGAKLNDYLKEMNQKVLSKYNIMTVGEMPGSTPDDAVTYTNLNGSELNMVFQFQHISVGSNPDSRLGKWYDQPPKLTDLKQALSIWQTKLDGRGWNSLYWDNHDQARAVSRFGNDNPAYRIRSAKMLALVLHFLQGTPYIYQGEELGMTNAHLTSLTSYEDIQSLNAYQEFVNREKLVQPKTMLQYLAYRSRDNARTVMQWSPNANAGFSTSIPWYLVNPNYRTINAEDECRHANSVFYFYQRLIQLRKQSKLIVFGHFQELDPKDNQVFAYLRTLGNHQLLIMANFTDQLVKRDYGQSRAIKLLINNYPGDRGVILRPYEAKAYRLR